MGPSVVLNDFQPVCGALSVPVFSRNLNVGPSMADDISCIFVDRNTISDLVYLWGPQWCWVTFSWSERPYVGLPFLAI